MSWSGHGAAMKKKIKLPNTASEWADVLEQPIFQNIVDRLATKRSWEIEEVVEAGEAGWVARAHEGATVYTLSLMVDEKVTETPPSPIIEWTVEAEAERHEKRRPSIALPVIMLTMSALFAGLGIKLGASVGVVILMAAAGVFPVGLFLGIILLHPLAARRARKRGPVAGRAEFLKEVDAAVVQIDR